MHQAALQRQVQLLHLLLALSVCVLQNLPFHPLVKHQDLVLVFLSIPPPSAQQL